MDIEQLIELLKLVKTSSKTISTEVETSEKAEWRIVILQRGWAMVGLFSRNGSDCVLSNASVIRKWGTTKGLGQLAKEGPLPDTTLDKCYGDVQFDYLTVVATISCNQQKWQKEA